MGDEGDLEREEEEIRVREEREKDRRDQLSLLALLLTLFRKRFWLACKTDRDNFSSAAGNCRSGVMEIGWPTDVQHVNHVTFDRFDGFLGLPVEFEPEVPRRAPSARYIFRALEFNNVLCLCRIVIIVSYLEFWVLYDMTEFFVFLNPIIWIFELCLCQCVIIVSDLDVWFLYDVIGLL